MDNPRVTVTLENKDMMALYNHIVVSQGINYRGNINRNVFLLLTVIVISAVMNLGDMKGFLYMSVIAVGILIFLEILRFIPILIHKMTAKMTEKSFMKKSSSDLQIEGTRTYVLSDTGMMIKSSYGDLEIDWTQVQLLEEKDDYIFIDAEEGKGSHVIPIKFFPSSAKKDEFINKAFYFFSEKKSNTPGFSCKNSK